MSGNLTFYDVFPFCPGPLLIYDQRLAGSSFLHSFRQFILVTVFQISHFFNLYPGDWGSSLSLIDALPLFDSLLFDLLLCYTKLMRCFPLKMLFQTSIPAYVTLGSFESRYRTVSLVLATFISSNNPLNGSCDSFSTPYIGVLHKLPVGPLHIKSGATWAKWHFYI